MTTYPQFTAAVDALLALPNGEQRTHLETRFGPAGPSDADEQPLLLDWIAPRPG